MDCEKFDTLLLDELYGELDELTSAAVKRHVAGCSRCSGILGGMKATRRLAVLPVMASPEGLEERILSAAREAQKVVPLAGRFSRFVSTAGSWAMRPQTQMAAVFLLMIGTTTTLFLRAHHNRASSAVTVTDEGAPIAAASAAAVDMPMDQLASREAHGAPAPVVVAATVAPTPAGSTALALADDSKGALDKEKTEDERGRLDGHDNANGPMAQAVGGVKKDGDLSAFGSTATLEPRNAAAPAGAPPPPAARPASPKAISGATDLDRDGMEEQAQAGAGGGASNGNSGYSQQMVPQKRAAGQDDFGAAMAQYRAHQYSDATHRFDALASTNGDNNASLWAARSVRDGSGCGAAVSRLDALSNRAWGTYPGYEATFDAASCYQQMGQTSAANDRYTRLLQVSTHQARAQTALNNMNAMASRKAPAAAHAASKAAAPASPPAQPPQAAPVATERAADSAQDSK